MKYVAAYTLLVLGGNENPSEGDLEKFLTSVDCEVNKDQLKACVSALSGKQLHELCNQGFSLLGSMNVGGPSGAQATTTTTAKVEVKEAEPEPVEEEEDIDFGDIFG